MNTHLAEVVADVIREKWDPRKRGIASEAIYEEIMVRGASLLIRKKWSGSSEAIYEEIIVRGEQIPEGDMKEIFDTFIKAGIIGGPRPINRDAFNQHGSMVITSVDVVRLKQLEFD